MNQPPVPPKIRRPAGGIIAGSILILVGALSLVSMIPGVDPGLFFLPALGAIFLAAGFITRTPGLLIPGCILEGIGVGAALIEGPFRYVESPAEGGIFLLAFAGGWVLLTLTTWMVGRRMLWPLIPAAVLGLVGGALLAGQSGLQFLEATNQAWPLVLIAIGLFILLRRRGTN